MCVISLPASLMLPRLASLVPNLMIWSHEHKAHFKAKVKHILERLIRRFGSDAIERVCPEEDRKLVVNIRKSRERSKRKRKDGDAGSADGDTEAGPATKRKPQFESEFDEAVYGDSDSDADSAAFSDDEGSSHRPSNKRSQTFIVEDETEPLDLLDRRSLANISSTKPVRARRHDPLQKTKPGRNGKLVFGPNGAIAEDDDDDAMVLDSGAHNESPTEQGGVGAYVEALRGKDAVQRGQRGKLKFSNRRDRQGAGVEEMDVDDGGSAGTKASTAHRPRESGVAAAKSQRKGPGVGRARGGRVAKAAGRARGRGRPVAGRR